MRFSSPRTFPASSLASNLSTVALAPVFFSLSASLLTPVGSATALCVFELTALSCLRKTEAPVSKCITAETAMVVVDADIGVGVAAAAFGVGVAVAVADDESSTSEAREQEPSECRESDCVECAPLPLPARMRLCLEHRHADAGAAAATAADEEADAAPHECDGCFEIGRRESALDNVVDYYCICVNV